VIEVLFKDKVYFRVFVRVCFGFRQSNSQAIMVPFDFEIGIGVVIDSPEAGSGTTAMTADISRRSIDLCVYVIFCLCVPESLVLEVRSYRVDGSVEKY
jgi:hypothetical protein